MRGYNFNVKVFNLNRFILYSARLKTAWPSHIYLNAEIVQTQSNVLFQ